MSEFMISSQKAKFIDVPAACTSSSRKNAPWQLENRLCCPTEVFMNSVGVNEYPAELTIISSYVVCQNDVIFGINLCQILLL